VNFGSHQVTNSKHY